MKMVKHRHTKFIYSSATSLLWSSESQIKDFSSMSWYEQFVVICIVYFKQWIMRVHEEGSESQIKGVSSMSWYEQFIVIFVVYSKQ